MKSEVYPIAVIAVVAACTLFTRWAPFLFFGGKKKTPKSVEYIGGVLPAAMIGVLVIYCIRNISFQSAAGFAPQLISALAVAALHAWKGNTLLSIGGGTVLYMALIRTLFI